MVLVKNITYLAKTSSHRENEMWQHKTYFLPCYNYEHVVRQTTHILYCHNCTDP